MTPAKEIEDMVRNARTTTNTATDERIIAVGEAAMAKRNEQPSAGVRTSGGIRRMIMKSNWKKLATAASILVTIGLGMYALTGSFDGMSITMAQVRQAMEKIDWMQIINRSEIEKGVEIEWYSFASKIEIKADIKGRVSYSDFKTRKRLFWPGEGKYIIESSIKTQEFAHGTSGPFEMIETGLQAGFGENVVKRVGTYQGRKVEIWTANQVKRGSTQKLILYIDINRRLPIAATFKREATDIVNTEVNYIEFKYPKTGPADIYEAGAPKTAKITPSPEQ